MKKLATAALMAVLLQPAVLAQPDDLSAPYDRMNLSRRQAAQIHGFDSDWNNQYRRLRPRMRDLQHRLDELLYTPKSDPLEITTTQQRISQIREQLGTQATSTYLRKRRVLNDGQRLKLDGWMRKQLSNRERGRQM
jgi:hypothetical protein